MKFQDANRAFGGKRSAWSRKTVLLLVCFFLLCTVMAGTTFAFLYTGTDPVENRFQPSHAACDVTETFDGSVKSDVKVQNTGEVDVYIRVAVIVSWMSSDQTRVAAVTPVQGTDYTLEMAQNTNWMQGDDGFWYFTVPVTAGTYTDVLIDSCCAVPGRAPEGFQLSVEIVASAIQASPVSVAETEWGVQTQNGIITRTGVSY